MVPWREKKALRGQRGDLLRAIQGQNVAAVREALFALSSTQLAQAVDETYPSGRRNEHASRRLVCLRLQIRAYLSAAIGPDPVHTQLAECLLTPQSFPERDDNDSSSSPAAAAANNTRVVTTDAGRLLQSYNPLFGTTPLEKACLFGNTSLVRLLLEHGANPNVCRNDGLTPLIRMARSGNLEIVKLLLEPPEEEAPPEPSTNHRLARAATMSPRIRNCNQNDHTKHQMHPNRWGTDVSHYDQQAMSALIHACAEGHEPVVRFLATGGSGQNPTQAAVAGFVNAYKVDPALWYASAHGHTSIVEFLMDDCGATPSYRKDPSVYSSTPLEEASEWGHAATVRALLKRSGSDPRTRQGQTARASAERAGHAAVVALLDEWTKILDALERTPLSPGLLPLVLSRRNDLAFGVLTHNACTVTDRCRRKAAARNEAEGNPSTKTPFVCEQEC